MITSVRSASGRASPPSISNPIGSGSKRHAHRGTRASVRARPSTRSKARSSASRSRPRIAAPAHALGAPAGRLSRVARGTTARGDPVMHVPVRPPCRDRGHPLARDPPLPLATDALYRSGTRPSRPRLDRGRSQPPPQATGKDAPLALRDAHGWCPATTTRPISPVISGLVNLDRPRPCDNRPSRNRA